MTDGMNVKSKMKRPCERETMKFHRRTIHCPQNEGRSTSLQLTDIESPRALLGDQLRLLRPSAFAGPGCSWRFRPVHDSLRAREVTVVHQRLLRCSVTQMQCYSEFK